jgi:hypothetical protein
MVPSGLFYQAEFLCERNDIVYLLTTIDEKEVAATWKGGKMPKCLSVQYVDKNHRSKVPYPTSWPSGQRVFFERWYYLRDWMSAKGIQNIFHFDADQLIVVNTTAWVHANREILKTQPRWGKYEPPSLSWAPTLLRVEVLRDILKVFDVIADTDNPVWNTTYPISWSTPNDMALLGHYSHLAEGDVHPCWSRYVTDDPAYPTNLYSPLNPNKPQKPPNTCAEAAKDHALPGVIAELKRRNVVAKYPTGIVDHYHGTVTPDLLSYHTQKSSDGKDVFRFGYIRGALWQYREGNIWIPLASCLLEDQEQCMVNHIAIMNARRTCSCTHQCCTVCTPEPGWEALDKPVGTSASAAP